jgi:iron complex outermembrane recepter protein
VFDIARVEVLRGPQGTLYGRNTTGGAVNFIGNRPTSDFHAGMTVDYGSHNAFSAEGFVSGSLSDALKGRLSWATEQGGAWQRNRVTGEKLGDKHEVAARTQFEWDASTAMNVRLNLHFSQDKSEGAGLQLFTPTSSVPGNPPVLPADTNPYVTGWGLRPSFAQSVGLAAGARPGVNNSNNGADLSADIDLGAAKLTSITAYNKLLRRELTDWDGTSYAVTDVFFRSEAKVFSQEIRLASTGTGPLGWVGGLYYSHEKLAESFYNDLSESPFGGLATTAYEQTGKSLGVFAQANYQFTSSLKGILGVRQEHETRDLSGLNTQFLTVGGFQIPSFTGGPQDRSVSSSDTSGKAALEYQWTTNRLLYGSISRGVKSGGFTTHNTLFAQSANPFKPEVLIAYELGIKADFTQTLRVNAAAFHYDYRDQQVLSAEKFTVAGANGPVDTYIGKFINAPKSRIDGGELEVQWRPIADLELSQYVGYKEGKFTDTVLNRKLVDFNGRDLDIPKLSYGGELAYSWTIGGFKLRAQTNYSFHDQYKQLFLLALPEHTLPSYWLANANLTLSRTSGPRWNATVWGRNILSKGYYLTKNFFLDETAIVAEAGEPATFGIRLSYSF